MIWSRGRWKAPACRSSAAKRARWSRPAAPGRAKSFWRLATAALEKVRSNQETLREHIEILCAPEQYPVVITAVQTAGSLSVEVAGNGGRLRVAVHPEVPREALRVGARGLLSQKRNCLLRVHDDRADWSDVGTFEEHLPEPDRVLIRHQEQLIAVSVSEQMKGVELKKGDLVGFDRDGARMAFSKVTPPGRQDLFFERTPEDRFDE